MRTLSAVYFASNLTFRVINQDLALAAFDEDHEAGHQNRAHQKQQNQRYRRRGGGPRPRGAVAPQRHPRRYTGKNDQRYPVANAPLGYLFAEPHQKHRPGYQRHDGGEAERKPRIDHQPALRFQRNCNAQTLKGRQEQRAVARVLGDLPATGFTLLLQLLERRRHHGHQLHDDRCRNVRHDPQCEDGKSRQGATREHLEHVRELNRIDPGNRNVRAYAVHDQGTQQEQQTALEVAEFAQSDQRFLRQALTFDASAGLFDGRARTLRYQQSTQSHFALDFAIQYHLRRQRGTRHHAGLLQHQDIDVIHRQLLDRRQPHLDRIASGERDEAAFGQAPMQGHLTALETHLVETA